MLTYNYFEFKVWVTLSHYLKIWHSSFRLSSEIWQNHRTMKYRSQWPIFILRSNVRSYWPIIPKYDVYTSNSLQHVAQNHWTVKYRSQWLQLFWGPTSVHTDSTTPNSYVHTSNSLQAIRQNHWTMKCRSQWPTFIFRSKVGSYWLIFPNTCLMFIHQIVFKI